MLAWVFSNWTSKFLKYIYIYIYIVTLSSLNPKTKFLEMLRYFKVSILIY